MEKSIAIISKNIQDQIRLFEVEKNTCIIMQMIYR